MPRAPTFTARFSVVLSPDQLAWCRKAAEREGLPLGAWMRRALVLAAGFDPDQPAPGEADPRQLDLGVIQ